jgi:TolA protein
MTSLASDEPQAATRLRPMIVLSAVLHVVVIAGVIVSGYFSHAAPPRSVAYTVELVNPAALGSNLPGGTKNGSPAEGESILTPKLPSPPPPQAAKPPAPVVPQKEPVKERVAEPPVKPAPEKVKVEEKKPEPPKVAKVEPPKPEPKKLEAKTEPEKAPLKKPEEKKPESKPTEAKPQKPEPKPEQPSAKEEKTQAKPEPPNPPVKAAEKTPEEKPPKEDLAQPDDRERQIAAALERVKARVQPKGDGNTEGIKGSGPITKGGEAGQGGGGEVRGPEFILYTQELQRRVQESWIVAEKKPGLLATVSFRIQADGEVQEVELMKSSGDAVFDQSVLRAVRKAAPFSPPPQAYAQEFTTQKIFMNFGGEGRVN